MRKAVFAIVIVLGASLAIMSCSPLGSGSANASRVVTGTITVPSQPDWTNLKIGVFSGGDLGDQALGTADNSLGVGKYRVIYNSGGSGPVPILPVAGASYSISDTSTTTSAYSFELPAAAPAVQSFTSFEAYYFAAWIDNGTTVGSLDLQDAFPSNVATTIQGEFNRSATKATTNLDGLPTTITINFFAQSADFSGNPSGNYKYNGHDLDIPTYNEAVDLTTDNNSGFNFDMSPSSGW